MQLYKETPVYAQKSRSRDFEGKKPQRKLLRTEFVLQRGHKLKLTIYQRASSTNSTIFSLEMWNIFSELPPV